MTVRGKTILSCGHEDEHGCWGIAVEFDEEQCVAGEGFVPTTVYAHYCHECAIEVTRQAAYAAGLERALELWASHDSGSFVTAMHAERDKT